VRVARWVPSEPLPGRRAANGVWGWGKDGPVFAVVQTIKLHIE